MVKSKPGTVPTCADDVILLPTAYVVFTHAEYLRISRDALTLRLDQSHAVWLTPPVGVPHLLQFTTCAMKEEPCCF